MDTNSIVLEANKIMYGYGQLVFSLDELGKTRIHAVLIPDGCKEVINDFSCNVLFENIKSIILNFVPEKSNEIFDNEGAEWVISLYDNNGIQIAKYLLNDLDLFSQVIAALLDLEIGQNVIGEFSEILI